MAISTEGPYTPEVSQGVVRAVIGVAAFAGLREGEIRGQWWEDDDGTFSISDALCGGLISMMRPRLMRMMTTPE
jgi:hypothetical protein